MPRYPHASKITVAYKTVNKSFRRSSPITAKVVARKARTNRKVKHNVSSGSQKSDGKKKAPKKPKSSSPIMSVVMVTDQIQSPASIATTAKTTKKTTTTKAQPELSSGKGNTTPKSAKPKSKKKESTVTKTPKSTKAKSPGRPKAKLVWTGPPDEPLDGGWPKGWTKHIYERSSGATKGGRDRYWFTPVLNRKLRSMVEVKRFMAALKQSDGDETMAVKVFKSGGKT